MSDNIPTETTEVKDDASKSAVYSRATTRLRKENVAAWNAILKDEYAKVGIEWNPKPTEEEKAAAEVERLLAAHPDLIERFAQR